MDKVYVCVSTGKNKDGKDQSRLAAVVDMNNGNKYINNKDSQYVDGIIPLLQTFKSTLGQI